MRKLILLALVGAAVYAIKSRRSEGAPASYSPTPGASGGAPAAGATAPAAAATEPAGDDLAELRSDQLEGAPTGDGVVPDTSDDDPLVRQQEAAAAAEAGSLGGPADSVTADVEPEMRPVVEGSGDAEETFEKTEDEGR